MQNMGVEMKDKLNSISEEKEKNTCYECKHFTPIISQRGAYKCLKKDRYFDYEYYKDCELFEQDIITLREKEERIWG